MKYVIFSLNDSVAETYGSPFIMANEALARRAAKDLANDPTSKVFTNPGDFNLFRLGTFDDETGVIEASVPAILVNCRSLKE